MAYSELSEPEQVLVAIGFVANGTDVPYELQELLGDELMQDITYPRGEIDG